MKDATSVESVGTVNVNVNKKVYLGRYESKGVGVSITVNIEALDNIKSTVNELYEMANEELLKFAEESRKKEEVSITDQVKSKVKDKSEEQAVEDARERAKKFLEKNKKK